MGCIYKRGNIWWIKYYRNGKAHLESSKSDKESKAKRLLKLRDGEIAKGEPPGIIFDKIRISDLGNALVRDYQINDKKGTRKIEVHVKTLCEFFSAEIREIPEEERTGEKDERHFEFKGGVRVTEITTDKVEQFIHHRRKDGLSNASINRELAALKRMFTLGTRARKVNHVPYIPMLQESNTRKGFFEHDEFLALRSALPSYLKPIVTFAYHTGWRFGEILGLTWEKIDLKNGVVRLDPGDPKNKQARTVFLNDELAQEMKVLQAIRNVSCPYVFQREGERIKRFTKAWKTACINAGLSEPLRGPDGNILKTKTGKTIEIPTRIFHDFRRTAVRNMLRSGVQERVAMTISGHKTRSVFDRYNIVNQNDLKEAAKKQENYIQEQNGYNLVTIEAERGLEGEAANA